MTTLLAILCIILSVSVLVALLTVRRLRGSIPGIVDEAVEATLRDFKKRSGRTRVGTTVEQLVPFMKEFPYDPSDVRIISGGPVDYIVFDGLSDGKIRELVFLDVKTGTARTNKPQKQVEDCAFRGQVRFTLFEVDSSGATSHPYKRIDDIIDLDDDARARLRRPG